MPTFNLGRAVGQVDIDTKGLKDADLSLREAGRGLIYTGGALVGAFGYVVKVAADFEKELDFVQAITQSTGEEMKQLADYATDLGRRGPYGPREVAAAFVELAKAGVDAEDIMGGVGEASVDLAAAADIGLTESTEILVNTLKTFGLEAEDAIYAVDQIAGAANASTIDVDDFAYSLRYAGSIAAAIGIPLDEVSTALAILGDRGIKGSTGGTSLRRVMLNLQPASEKAADALKELGIITEDGTNQFFTAEGQAKSLADVFQILGDSMDGLTDAERLQAVNTIFGARAAPAALILAGQGAEGFDAYTEAIARTTAADVAAARLDNLAGAVTKLKAAIEATFITAGTPFQDMLQGWVEGITQVVVWFGELDPRIQSFLLGAVGVIGVMALLSGAFLLTVGNIVRAIRVAGELVNAFRAISGVIKVVAGVFRGLTLVMAANPFVLIVLAIIALVAAFYLLYTRSEKFRNFINGLGEKIQEVWGKVVDFFEELPAKISAAFDKAKAVIGGFFDDIGGAIGGALTAVGDFFSDLFGGIASIGTGAFDGVTGFFETLASIDLGSTFSKALAVVTEFVGELPGMLGNAASTAVDAFAGFMEKLPGRLGYALGFAIGRLIKWNIDFYTKIYELGVQVVQAVIDWGGKLISAMIDWMTGVIVEVSIWVVNMVTKAVELGTQFLLKIVEFFSQLPGKVAGFLLGVLTAVVTAIPGIVAAAVDLGLQVLTSIVSFVMQLPGKVAGFLVELGGAILGAIPELVSFSVQLGEGVLNGIVDIITGLPGMVLNVLTNTIDTIKGQVTAAFNAAKDFGGGLWNGFKDGLGISSPSFIERALFAIQDQANRTAQELNSSVGYINQQAHRLPEFATAGAPATAMLSAGRVANSSIAGTETGTSDGGVHHHYHAPLVGQAEIKREEDIYVLAHDLENERNRRNRGKGKR